MKFIAILFAVLFLIQNSSSVRFFRSGKFKLKKLQTKHRSTGPQKFDGFFTENDFPVDDSTDKPLGRDKSKQNVATGQFWIKRSTKFASDVPRGFTDMIAKVNQDSIYLLNAADSHDYKKIVTSLTLKDLLKTGDNPKQLKCCKAVQKLRASIPVLVNDNQEYLNCFKIASAKQDWEICGDDLHEVANLREKLLLNMVIAGGYVQLSGVSTTKDPIIFNPSFTWSEQNNWKGICKSGTSQSPVAIQANIKRPGNLVFIYESISMPSIDPENDEKNQKTAIFDQGEYRVEGDFGKMQHIDDETTVEYTVDFIKFKFPAEHFIFNHQYEGEIQVHHSSDSGAKAVVSFMIREDDQAEQNLFVAQLDLGLWKPQQDHEVEISGNPILEELVNGGITQFLNKNFYWYVGSESTPPCSEGVNHFVLETPIIMNKLDIDALKTASFNSMVESRNQRDVQPLGLRTVYFARDISGSCGVEGDPCVAVNGFEAECDDCGSDSLGNAANPLKIDDSIRSEADQGLENGGADNGNGSGENSSSSGDHAGDNGGPSPAPGQPSSYQGTFYVENMKINDKVWIPAEGASKIALGDLGNGVVLEEDDSALDIKKKMSIQAKYHEKFPPEPEPQPPTKRK